MTRKEAYIALNLLSGIGPLRVTQLLSCFNDPVKVLSSSVSELSRVPGIGSSYADKISNWSDHCDLEKELELIGRAGVHVLSKEDDDYPPLLKQIHDPPLCLYVRGDPSVLGKLRQALAIVGSRRTTRYGVRVAEKLSASAAMAGWPVVSGLARGIDTVAHRSALDMNGCTISVLGSGLARIYPQENVELARRMAGNGGAVVSEFPMMYRPDKRTFPMRNRVISGMCVGCIVIEAGDRSGSLITASQAVDQNRLVFAVPGQIDSPQSRGCHRLIKQGAKLVESFEDVLEEFTFLPGMSTTGSGKAGAGESGENSREIDLESLNLTETEEKILIFLDGGELSIDAVIADIDRPASQILSALVTLEMKRLVTQLPGRRVVSTAGRISGQ